MKVCIKTEREGVCVCEGEEEDGVDDAAAEGEKDIKGNKGKSGTKRQEVELENCRYVSRRASVCASPLPFCECDARPGTCDVPPLPPLLQ